MRKLLLLSKIHSVISAVVFTIAMGMLPLGSSARAQETNTATEDAALFGTFSQLNSGVTYTNPLNVGPQACVPTATANSLIYLQNTFGITNLVSVNYDTVNALAQYMGTINEGPDSNDNGTSFTNQESGLDTYLTTNGFSSTVGISEAIVDVTVQNLFNWLAASNAVTIWINWGGTNPATNQWTNGAHALSLYSIGYTTDGSGDPISGTLGFIDPYGTNADSSAATAVNISTATFIVTNNLLFVNGGYIGGAGADTNSEDPGGFSTGFISNGLDFAAVPESSTCVLLVLGWVALVIAANRRRV